MEALQGAGYVRDALGVALDPAAGVLAVDRLGDPLEPLALAGLGDAFVPGRGPLIAVAGSPQQHQPGDAIRVQESGGHRDDSTHRVPDQDRPVDAGRIERANHVPGQVLPAVWAGRCVRTAVAPLVDPQQGAALRQARRKAFPNLESVDESV